MDMLGATEFHAVQNAIIILHRKLKSMIPGRYAFMGGFQIMLVGGMRNSKDLDIQLRADCEPTMIPWLIEGLQEIPTLRQLEFMPNSAVCPIMPVD
jgi:hypothetical protein